MGFYLALLFAFFMVVKGQDNVTHEFKSGSGQYFSSAKAAPAGMTKCMEHLGCFSTGGDFYHPLYRPINFLPFDREIINVRFRIYNKGSGDNYQVLSALKVPTIDINEIKVDPELETKVITHGWLDNQLIGDWMRDYKDDYYKVGNYNIIIADWSGGNAPPFTQAVANTRVAGAEIALLINRLVKDKGLNPRKVHIMGHSLGAQLVGYAGERIKNLGRITSLDPSEPFYQYMPPSVRIDPTDAEFVEVIHSDSKPILQLQDGLGMMQLAGHVDFFPNNGRDQPGCSKDKIISLVTDGLVEWVRNIAACDHIRAVNYFRESITSSCPMVHIACADYETYLAGRCTDCGVNGEKCAILGERSIEYSPHKNDEKQIKMYAKTNGGKPYCFYNYQVQIKLQESKSDQKGTMFLKITGNGNEEEFQLGERNMKLIHGAQYTYLVSSSRDFGEIEQLTVRWRHEVWINIFTKRIFVEQVKVTPIHAIDKKERALKVRQVCVKGSDGIDSGKSKSYRNFSEKC